MDIVQPRSLQTPIYLLNLTQMAMFIQLYLMVMN